MLYAIKVPEGAGDTTWANMQLAYDLLSPKMREFLDGLTRKAISETVLIGWKGIKVHGKDVKHSPEKAEELMIQFPDFQEDVITAATTHETFRREAIEENEGNSETS